MSAPLPVEKEYTDAEFAEYAEQDNASRYELIDGAIYALGSPTPWHQRVFRHIFTKFSAFFEGKPCEVLSAPLDVHLDANARRNKNVYQPDIFVICDKRKVKDNAVYGAPGLVVEVTSPSTSRIDYIFKLSNYFKYGVREYWIVDDSNIMVYIASDNEVRVYSHVFNSLVESRIFPGLAVDFGEFHN